jgi:DNA primase
MISDDTIERVRREARVVAIVGERVKLTLRGRSHIGLCPFHKEKTPSFNVNEERGFYHCFGCGASGDAIKFLRELDGLSFVDAIRHIAERQGIEIVETGNDAERREQAEARRRRDELFAAGESAAAFFEKMLVSHPLASIATEELARRGLDPQTASEATRAALASFRMGYAPYAWDAFAKHLKDTGVSVRAAEAVGIVVPRKKGPGHYDRFRHRLMFAIVDLEGRIVGFSGRALRDPTPEELSLAHTEAMGTSGEPPAKYLNSPESAVYKKREIVFGLWQARQSARREDRTVLVEGNFDVVSLHARGITNVVAPLGTAFTEEQAAQLRRFSQHVTLLFDGDSAGRRAVRASREPARAAGLVVSVGSLPDGKDPDDIAKAGGAEAVLRYVKAAPSLLEYLINAELVDARSNDPATAAAKIKAVEELIRSEHDPTVRAFAKRHADAMAQRLNVGDERTLVFLERVVTNAAGPDHAPASTAKPIPAPPDRARSPARGRDIGLEILGSLLDFPSLLARDHIHSATLLLEGDAALAVAALRHNGALVAVPEHLLAKLPASIHPFAAARLAAPRHQSANDAEAELLGNVEKLKRLELTRHKSETIEELARMQSSGDFDREMALLGEQARRSRERHGL